MKKQEEIYLVKKGLADDIETIEYVGGTSWEHTWMVYSTPIIDLERTPKGWSGFYRTPSGAWREIHLSAAQWEEQNENA